MTQSSMHFPPLRHGRRARHTEAADTGGVRPSHACPPYQSFHLQGRLCHPLAVTVQGFFPGRCRGASAADVCPPPALPTDVRVLRCDWRPVEGRLLQNPLHRSTLSR